MHFSGSNSILRNVCIWIKIITIRIAIINKVPKGYNNSKESLEQSEILSLLLTGKQLITKITINLTESVDCIISIWLNNDHNYKAEVIFFSADKVNSTAFLKIIFLSSCPVQQWAYSQNNFNFELCNENSFLIALHYSNWLPNRK